MPAQIEPARAFVTGIGEEVEPLPDPAPFGVLVLPGTGGLSTPSVYAQADRMALGREPEDLLGKRAVVRAAATALPAELVRNDLEAAASALAPGIGPALADARALGADHAMVSGSGPTVIGLFAGPDGPARARAAAARAAASGAHPRAVAAEPVGPRFARPRVHPTES